MPPLTHPSQQHNSPVRGLLCNMEVVCPFSTKKHAEGKNKEGRRSLAGDTKHSRVAHSSPGPSTKVSTGRSTVFEICGWGGFARTESWCSIEACPMSRAMPVGRSPSSAAFCRAPWLCIPGMTRPTEEQGREGPISYKPGKGERSC